MFGAPGGSCGASSSALGVVLELCTLGRLSQAPHPRALSQLYAYHCSETHVTLKLHAYTHTHIHTRVHVWNTESRSEATLTRSIVCFRSISFGQTNTCTRQHFSAPTQVRVVLSSEAEGSVSLCVHSQQTI